MQREYMYFYKGFWLAIYRRKAGFNLKILTEDQLSIVDDTSYDDMTRVEVKNFAETLVDIKLAQME